MFQIYKWCFHQEYVIFMNVYEPNSRSSKYKTKAIGNTGKFDKFISLGNLNVPLSEVNQ